MRKLIAMSIMVTLTVMFGCGGGGSSSSSSGGNNSAAKLITGTVSKGSAIPFGTVVTATDMNGVTKTTTVGINGIYSIDVAGLTAPFLLHAGSYYSSANGAGVTNINPLTDLCVKATLGTSSIPAVLPTVFPGQFTTTVNAVLNSLESLYPATVTASKQFLGGDITLGAGVDLAFDYLTITPPTTTSATFTIAAKTTATTSTVLTGSVGASTFTVTPATMAALSAVVFPPSAQDKAVFTSAMLEYNDPVSPPGVRFTYYTTDGAYGTLILLPHTTFYAGQYVLEPLEYGTFVDSTATTGASREVGRWSINSAGQVELKANLNYSATDGNVSTLTLAQVTDKTYTVIETRENTKNATVHLNSTMILVFEPLQTNLSAIASGKTMQYATATGNGSIYFLANGTYSSTDTVFGAGTWSLASNNNNIKLTATSGQVMTIAWYTGSSSGTFNGDYRNDAAYTLTTGMSFVLY